MQRISSLEVDQITHDNGIVRLLVDFLIRCIICGSTGFGSVFAVDIIICLVDRIRLALYQNIPGICIVIICLFLIGQFRRIVPCTRNIIHCHAVIGYKGIFAQSHNILAAILLNCIGRLNLRRICTLICICIFFGICVVLLFRCVLEIDVPILSFAV